MEPTTLHTMACPWGKLPDELCTHLFSLLDVSDLCTSTLVCRQWSSLAWAERRELNLKPFFKQLGDEALFSLLRKVPKVVDVTIKGIANSEVTITDAAIEELVLRCPKVESLSLINCTKLTPKSIQTIAQAYSGQLVSLAVKGCVSAITDVTLQSHFAALSSLRHLSLEGCWKVTNNGIKALSTTCSGLRTIKLSGCYKLSDLALQFLADNCQGLEKWKLARLPAISDQGVARLAGVRGTSLRSLDLTACRSVRDEGLAAVLTSCPDLEELCVTHCARLSSRPFLDHISNCPKITTLDIQRVDIVDEGIKAIITACPNLKVANLKSKSYLDPAILATIPIHCPDIEVLRLYGDRVDKELFLNISIHCKHLHTLDLRRLRVPFEDAKIIGSDNSACKRSLRRLFIIESAMEKEQIAWFQEQFPLAVILGRGKLDRAH